MTSVVVCGIAGHLPMAGVAMHYLQYCLGLRDMGVDVSYLEDNRAWPLHPEWQDFDESGSYSIPWLAGLFDAFDMPYAYQTPDHRWHGATGAEAHARCARADLLLNVSGGATFEDHHRRAKAIAYVDTDPAFTQVASEQSKDVRDWIGEHDLHFTFATLIDSPSCRLPSGGFDWIATRQPVWLPFWAETPDEPGDTYTTVMNWRAYGIAHWNGEEWGQKDAEFPTVLDLPSRTGVPLEVAIGGDTAPRDEIAAAGWKVVDPRPPTRTVWTFRDYLASSRGELSVAKQGYVRARTGWFSERSANYLASGRPVIAQDTGWSEWLPVGKGLHSFSTAEEAVAAVAAVEADPAGHARAARRLAAGHFDAAVVLERLLSDAGVD